MCFKPSGEPHAAYQGSYLVPILAEALAIPTSARLRRISEFLRFGPVTFDTLVLHTGSGDIVPLSTYFNRHLTKLDELNDMFYGHASQEDGIVLSQGLGLNEQELEMRSILVRVHQELVKAAVNTSHRQETTSQEEQQAPAAQAEGLKSPPEQLSLEEEKCNLGEEKRKSDDMVKVVVDQIEQEQGKTGKEEEVVEEQGGQGEQEQVEGDIVELESLMRANFLVVDDEVATDEVQGDEVAVGEVQANEVQLVVADEVQQDSAEGEGDPR